MSMKATGIRLPDGVKVRLRTLAHQESLRTGSEVSWTDLVREAVDEFLAGRDDGQPQPTLDSPAQLGDTAEMECISFGG
jgi:hypothetical protein